MANPFLVGQANAAGGSTTLVISVANATSAGGGNVIVVGAYVSQGTVSGVTDSKGNSYSLVQSDTNRQATYRFECISPASALTTSDTITVTCSASAALKAAGAIALTQMENVAQGVQDQNPAGADNAGTTTPTITSGALAQPYEVCVAVEANAAAGGAVAWGSGFTGLVSQEASTGAFFAMAYKIVASAATVTASGTITSAAWTILFSSYRQSVRITTTSLPSAQINLAYQQTVAVTGGTGSYTWSITSGALPTGLTLDTATGLISGTPTAAGTSSFTVRAADTNGSSYSQSLSITVNAQGSPFVIATFNAAAGGTVSPQIPVVNNIYDGDTILVSCLANAGSVSGVTDSAGNIYTLVQSETPNASAQIYTFAAYNASPFTAAPPTGAGPVGAITHASQYPGLTTSAVGAANIFDGLVGLPNMAISAQKIYFQPSPSNNQYPTAVASDIQGLLNVKCQLYLCFCPNQPGTTAEATKLSNCIKMFNAAASAAGAPTPKIVLWQEGNNARAMTNAQFVTMFQYYYPTVSALGNKVVYNATAGSASGSVQNCYPGDASCDEVSIDYYCTAWVNSGQTFAEPLALQTIADNAQPSPKPFGFLEIGLVGAGATPTQAQFASYMNKLTTTMSGRIQQGKTNGAVLWFNGHLGVDANTIQSASDYRIPYIGTLYNSIAPVPSNWIQPVWTSSSSVQGCIAIADDGVQPFSDVTVGATASSGTTMSVSTGSLTSGDEHLFAFFADLSAGGAPVLGDSLTQLAQVQQGPYLTAAWKQITAADTPSATITSTVWSLSVVTNPLPPLTLLTIFATGIIGDSYSQSLAASGGQSPYTWSITSGALPTGLTLSAGIISGTPTAAGTFSFTLQATDSKGLIGSFAVSITILASLNAGAAITPLPTNRLAAADSDFEVSGFTWAPGTNANAPYRASNASVTGSYSLAWVSAAPVQVKGAPSSVTSITTGKYAATAGLPYIGSLFALPCRALSCTLGLAWYDGTGAYIGTSWGQPNQSPGTAWQPMQVAGTAPTSAASVALTIQAVGVQAGDVTHIDLAFLTQANCQVLVDWFYPAFAPGSSAGNAFMDVSAWVRMDSPGVSYTRGRQDAISEIQPGSASFSLQNDQGTFTRFSSNAIPTAIGGVISLHERCQINLADETGTWWTRFDGTISEIDYQFDNTGGTSQANITVTDILSYLARQDALSCWTKEQALADGPLYRWALDDSGGTGGTGVAAETSGNNGPPMRLVNSDSTKTATIAWRDTSGGVETLADAVGPTGLDGSSYWTPGLNQPSSALRGLASGRVGPFTTPLDSISLTPVQTAQSAQNTFIGNTGYMLMAELPQPIAPTVTGTNYSLETWFTMDVSLATNLSKNYGPYIVLGLGSSRTFTNMMAGLFLNAGALNVECATYNQPPAFKGLNWPGTPAPSATASTSAAMAADKVRLPHHLVITIQGDPSAATVQLWIDGNSIGTFTLPKGQTYDTITVGGAYGGCGAFYGNISVVSVYPYRLSQTQITQHCQLGQYGMWETPGDDCVAQLAGYTNTPPFWNRISALHIGLTMTEYFDITGANALSAIQQYEQAEGGLLYVDANGALNFHTRDWRMGYPAPDLYLPPNTFDANMQYELVDNIMCNEMAVSGPNTLGATATTVLQNSATGATSTQTSTSTLLSATYVNIPSQNQYGVYTQDPIGSPLALPLITWSRAYGALGIPSLTYWPDPNLSDLAAWRANSRADPQLLPATLTIDLLTLDPNTGLAISQLYALDIDNMIAPNGTLPAQMPNQAGAVEWFIEGVTESITQTSRTLQFYTSPAAPQRAWIPGDGVYGVLGSTTRIGVSATDLTTPQADGKDVAHDAGPPYWPPAFSTNMNSQISHGFVGSNDIRGLAGNLQQLLTPPMAVVTATSQTQSITNGSQAAPDLFWDVIHADTAGTVGLLGGWPNWYVVTTPGWYEIDWCVTWSLTGTGLGGYTGQAWIVVAQQAAQALASGVANPRTVNQYVYPVGEAVRFNSSSMTPVCSGTTRMYLGLGDMVAIAVEQNYTSARSTSTAGTGSAMSLRFTGIGTVDDRAEINSSIANGGTVSIGSHGPLQTATFVNTHTYSYQGDGGWSPNGRRNTDRNCYQGLQAPGEIEASQVAQVAFNVSAIQSTLTGHTPLSATLTASNLGSYYSTGCKMMLGWSKVTPGGATFDPTGSNNSPDVIHQSFAQGQLLTFSIPVSMITAFVTGGAKALVIGDGDTTNLKYGGSWAGGPGNWTLTVNYV